MKKLLVILLLLVYGASASGMKLHLHYCCGKLEKVDFAPPEPRHCSKGNQNTMGSKSCCDSKEISITIKGEQDAVKVFEAPFQTFATKLNSLAFLVSSPKEAKKLIPEVFAPPPLQKDFNKLYCVYKI